MRGVPKPKITTKELILAVHVLNRLKRQIDCKAEEEMTRQGAWFLYRERAALITQTAMHRMEAIELVTECIVQWYALLQDTEPTSQLKSQNRKAK